MPNRRQLIGPKNVTILEALRRVTISGFVNGGLFR
jgi:hypothetical protein